MNYLVNDLYLKMTIIFKSSYGYQIEKKVQELTFHDFDYIESENFTNVSFIGYREHRKKHGFGMIFENGQLICKSEFHNNKKNGKTWEYKNTELAFLGMYENGKKQGFGQIYRRNELYYEGFFENDKYHGFGTLYGNEYMYTGNFIKNKMNGYCQVHNKYSGLPIYLGNFEDDVIQGFGKNYIYEAEDNNTVKGIYEGGFKNAEWDGEGKYKTESLVLEGTFQKGYFVYGKKYILNDLVYEGNFKKNKYHGHGISMENSQIYIGFFKFGLKHGVGTLLDSSTADTIYEGKFKDNHMCIDSEEYSKSELKINSFLENPKDITSFSKHVKLKNLKKYIKKRNIPIRKKSSYKKKNTLVKTMVQFKYIEKELITNQKCFLPRIEKMYMLEYLEKNKKQGLVKKTKEEIWNEIKKKYNLEKKQEERYDFFGNLIETPVLANDLQIYEKQSIIELQRRNMTPTIHNNIPITSFESFHEVQHHVEKKKIFDTFLKLTLE